jgi:hypothetical protein
LAISGLAGAVKHSFKIAKIANFYFEPLLSDDQKGKADMFVWERTNNPGKLRQVYVGTVDVRSGLIPHVEALQDRLGIG